MKSRGDFKKEKAKKQATMIYTLAKKRQYYDPDKVFGEVRSNQLAAA